MRFELKHADELLHRGYVHLPLDDAILLDVADAYRAWTLVFKGVAKCALRGELRAPWGYAPLRSDDGWAMKESYYCRPNEWVPPLAREPTSRVMQRLLEITHAVGALVNEVADMKLIDGSDACLRIMRYPGLVGDRESAIMHQLVARGMLRADAHVDLNVMTALPPPTAPGLQVRSGEVWKTIDDDPTRLVLQTGRQIEERSDGRYQGCVHRVRNPVGDEVRGSRIAAAFFVS